MGANNYNAHKVVHDLSQKHLKPEETTQLYSQWAPKYEQVTFY